MRRITIVFVIALEISILSFAVADPCGNKLLRMGRGARFQRSLPPAMVLIYLPSTAPAELSTKAPKLQAFLKKAGHKSSIVQGADRLSQALGQGQYDIILTDLSEIAGVQEQIEGSASKPILVPMIFK